MARRKKKALTGLDMPWPILAAGIGLVIAINVLSQITASEVIVVGAFAAVTGGIYVYHRHAARQNLAHKVVAIIDEDIKILALKRRQLLHKNDYGVEKPEKWNKEIAEFLSTRIIPQLSGSELALFKRQNSGWSSILDERVRAEQNASISLTNFRPNMTGPEFEWLCAEELQRIGWDARTTKGSGDQGADIIAQKNGIKIVLQCKRYNQPVGNKAVQEALLAREHEKADFAAVVSNARYTKAAREVQNTCRIPLLHYTDLRNMDAIVSAALPPFKKSGLSPVS